MNYETKRKQKGKNKRSYLTKGADSNGASYSPCMPINEEDWNCNLVLL